MIALYPITIGIYYLIIILACSMSFNYFKMRQLVKANFWINVSIFILLAFLTLLFIIDTYSDI